MQFSNHIVSVMLFIALFLSLSCSDLKDNVNLPIGRDGYALVLINLGFPDEVAVSNPTIWDRLHGLFTTAAHAQSAPPALIGSATVRVFGADFGIIEQSFTGSPLSAITLNVPAGLGRTIEVIANVATGDPSFVLSYRGTTLLNLTGGVSVSVPVTMAIQQTKLVIPDRGNARVVVIDTMSGTNWTVRTGSIFAAGTFLPIDVDFDSKGRLYLANYDSSVDDILVRVDDVNGKNRLTVGNLTNMVAIAMDRPRNIIYYASAGSMRRRNMQTLAAAEPLGLDTITVIRGMTVDDDGTLFIAGSLGADNRVFRYNPASQSVVNSVSVGLAAVRDVILKSGIVHVADESFGRILLFDRNLQTLGAYGTQTDVPTSEPGRFYGPTLFIGTANAPISLLDQKGNVSLVHLVSFNPIMTIDWSQYGSLGSGIGQFAIF